ncbi:hypothetical protein FRB90_007156 [Tulasnella sp. 427]|nr:hypothetical protein FRB90_007156 [Tulasnella sp. 427]
MSASKPELTVFKANLSLLDLVKRVERELAEAEIQLVDDATDAAFLISGLSLNGPAQHLEVDMAPASTGALSDETAPAQQGLKRKSGHKAMAQSRKSPKVLASSSAPSHLEPPLPSTPPSRTAYAAEASSSSYKAPPTESISPPLPPLLSASNSTLAVQYDVNGPVPATSANSSCFEQSINPDVPPCQPNHRKRRDQARRAARRKHESASLSKRQALYRKAQIIASHLDAAALPHSSQGYIGSSKASDSNQTYPTPTSNSTDDAIYHGPLPSNSNYTAHPRLLNLIRGGYTLVSTSVGPTLFMDRDQRIIGWRMGVVGGDAGREQWDRRNGDLTEAVEELASHMGSRRTRAGGVARGEHSWAHWGYSYGGGEREPSSRQQNKRERRWWAKLLQHTAYQETTREIQDTWKTWAPNVFADYESCHRSILERQPNLDIVHGPEAQDLLPFASLTANLGPQTVCKQHRDIKNKASGGICGIKTLGAYDFRLGGHIVLHELGLVIEMRPGDVAFFPSAVITHETIPIGSMETRYSLVWYSAGGLFRWRDADFRSLVTLGKKDRHTYNSHQIQGESRWCDGWRNFSTLEELIAKADKTETGSK